MGILRFKLGEHARLAYMRAGKGKTVPGYAPGIEVVVVAVGPFVKGQVLHIGKEVIRLRNYGDYVVDFGNEFHYACVLDQQLIKLTDPDGETMEQREEIEA